MKTNPVFKEKIRFPAVAGQFYPEGKRELNKALESLFEDVEVPEIPGKIFGLVLPHAGYDFSGKVAACGVKAVSKEEIETVIIIGDSHYEYFDGVSVWPGGVWQTPLGNVEVDEDLAQKILSSSKRFLVRDSAHLFEHCLEVQIPLFQRTLKYFKILPIVFGSEDKDWRELAQAIIKSSEGKKVLIVASSDLSHYPPYKVAEKSDMETINAILSLDVVELKEKIKGLEKKNIANAQTFLCAQDSVKTLMEIAKFKKAKAKLLKYANSGDTGGDKNKVVGYSSIAFFK